MSAICYIYFLTYLVFINYLCLLGARISVQDDLANNFDYDGVPGANHEFRVEVPAGKEECFYQRVKKGAKLHVSFMVLRGGQRRIDFYVRDPRNTLIVSDVRKSKGSLEKDSEIEGVYEVCVDNTRSQFTSMLVYIDIFVYQLHEWELFMADVIQYEGLQKQITTSLGEVDQSISQMRRYQVHARKNVMRDWYLIMSNNTYISYYSFVQCFVIVLSSCAQVYFLRRFFRNVSVTPTWKPRIYEICLSNSENHFSSKLIYLYIIVFRMSEWAQYAKELEDVHELASNFSIKLTDVEISISEMFKFQTMAKMHDVKDWYLISSNHKYVGYWSLVQCIVILAASGLQVYFIRRLFESVNVSPAMSQKA